MYTISMCLHHVGEKVGGGVVGFEERKILYDLVERTLV